MNKKIFLIACEASGDTHGAHLVKNLKALDPNLEFRGLGGPEMKKAGVDIFHDMTQMSALGFGDVLKQYFKYRKIFYQAYHQAMTWKPDVIIPIDSPAFNLRFAKKINNRFPILYYIAPQVWAWGKGRVRVIRRYVTKILSILPFEKEFFEKHEIPCSFVGHPLLDEIHFSDTREALRAQIGLSGSALGIGLFPGSRKKEITRILPPMLEAARLIQKEFPDAKFFMRPSPNVPSALYEQILSDCPVQVQSSTKPFHDLAKALDFALVTSGTATLQTALCGLPFFLLYKTNFSTYWLGRFLIKVKFLGLVNLLAGHRIVPEFIQETVCPKTIAHEAAVLLKNREPYERMKREFESIRHLLGAAGASRKAAKAVLDLLSGL